MKKLIFWLLIFLLSTQFGFHFWPNFSFVSGFKIDYLSPTIYLTDLFIILFVFISRKKINKTYLLPFIVLAFFNTLYSFQPLLSFFSWLKLFLYLLLFLSLLKVKNLEKLVYSPLLASLILIFVIQLAQLFLQSSVGGPLYLLGERSFNFYTPNIAKLNLGNLGSIIRPYSIFSHPNSLAGFLLLLLVVIKWPKKIKYLISLGVIFTFSKIAILTLLLLRIKNRKILKSITIISLIAGFLPLLVNFTNIKYVPGDTFLARAYMGYSTFEVIKQNFFTGTGLRGFIPSLAQHISPSQLNNSSLQPVHSLPLLIFSEFGLLGVAIICILFKKAKISNILLIQILFIVAITGAVDHYWWTLPQNQLILILALALGHKYNNHDTKNT